MSEVSRRTVIGTMLYASGLTSAGVLSSCGGGGSSNSSSGAQATARPESLLDDIEFLLAPDQNGVMLPLGFSSRIVARSGEAPASSSDYIWHDAPDGGAIFETDTGGWIYASNSERSNGRGGVGALVFDDAGNVIDAYSILSGTDRNCAGGATPWGTWLSCEESSRGSVWECDPNGINPAVRRSALGAFTHEAVAVNPETNILYMTEDRSSGLFYRFIPDGNTAAGIPDLTSGRLQAAIVDFSTNAVTWGDVEDPQGDRQSTRRQVEGATEFNSGEGIVFYDNVVSFTTKGDNRIWAYQTDNDIMSVIYDQETSLNPILSGVDNMTLSKEGELIISEDGGDSQIVAITKTGRILPIVQLVGHESSELTGPAFSPDGKRLYFSSQRGTGGDSDDGLTFEVSGPFHS